MARVEADAAASAGEKQQLRLEYEAKLAAVAGLQQQMKQQVEQSKETAHAFLPILNKIPAKHVA